MKDTIHQVDRKDCLNEMQINRYLLHQCSKKELQKIENHLIHCSQCRMEVVFLTQSQTDIHDEKIWDELPDRLYDKGMVLVKRLSEPQESYLEICLRLIRKQWEIFRHTGSLLPQPALSMRGEIPDREATISSFIKEFNGYRIEVDLKQGVKESIDLQIRVQDSKEESSPPKVRFTLRDRKRQRILDEFTQAGEISFKGLRPGKYSVEIALAEKFIGEIMLDMQK